MRACALACAGPGRAHRLRVRDRAAPSERDGAIEHVNCATLHLHTAPVRRRPAAARSRGPPGARVRGRRAVALVLEIATPSSTSSPFCMSTAPPYACTRADAGALGRAIQLHAQPRCDASRGGTAHATDMRIHAPHADAVRANKHVCKMRWGFKLLQVRKNYQLAITDYFTSIPTTYSCSNCCRLGTRSSTRASASARSAN